jgi:hypothetical protein
MPTVTDFLGHTALYVKEGQMIFAKTGTELQPLLDLRGWGAIQQLFKTQEDAAAFQDQLGEWVADAINRKLNPMPATDFSKYAQHLPECNTMQDWLEADQALADTPQRFRDGDFYHAVEELQALKTKCTCGLNDLLQSTGPTERFKRPTDEQVVGMALLVNLGKVEQKKIADMVALADMIIDRLYENGDIVIASSKEV